MEDRIEFYKRCFEVGCSFCGEVLLVFHKDKVHTRYQKGTPKFPVEDPNKRYACDKCGRNKKCSVALIRIRSINTIKDLIEKRISHSLLSIGEEE